MALALHTALLRRHTKIIRSVAFEEFLFDYGNDLILHPYIIFFSKVLLLPYRLGLTQRSFASAEACYIRVFKAV